MHVRTIQGYDLRVFNGRIDPMRGPYSNQPEILLSMRKLYGLLRDDQLIWCDCCAPLLGGNNGRYLHEIKVDSRDIATVIDSLHWCHIIGYGDRYIPHEEYVDLRRRAGSDSKLLREAEDRYLAQNLCADLWSGLMKRNVSKSSDQLLLRFPFAHSLILNVSTISNRARTLNN